MTELRRLLSQEDVDVDIKAGFWNRTPLMLATRRNNPEICHLLLRHGADLTLTDDEGYTAMMFACVACDSRLAVLRVMLEYVSPRIDLDVRNRDGWTCLMLAVWHKSPACLRLLLGHGASTQGVIKYISLGLREKSVMEYVRDSGKKEIVDVFEEYERRKGEFSCFPCYLFYSVFLSSPHASFLSWTDVFTRLHLQFFSLVSNLRD